MQTSLANPALRALRRILRATDRVGKNLAATTGLTPSQLLVLQEIDRREETTPSVIAATLQFGQPTVTSIVDRLVKAGLVTRQRSAQDKRQMLLHVTAAGQVALDTAPDQLQAQFQTRFAVLPAWEQAMILSALERMSELLDAQNIDAAPLLDSGPIDRSGPG
ncbi:MAG: MarR family transcriptional regulator [Sphingomonadales bacterium]|nr:MAG: MarR family transcriptional regulator [Sphingomonadales bacterium]TNF05502.1 MAG: MarR family transcriptional regulator [Sphingomonadales bacterium]